MTNNLIGFDDILLDFEALTSDAIALEKEQIDRAVELSRQVVPLRQWQAYLNALALFSFEQWLEERAADLRVNRENCTAVQPKYANIIEAVCNLRVGEFKVCLIAAGSLSDDRVSVPRAAVDLPEFIPHFYVLVEVREEAEEARIAGFLRRDELVNLAAHLQPSPEWIYELPRSRFDGEPDRLLLYLRCLEPTAIAIPSVPNRPALLSRLQADLTERLQQLGELPLWQVLSWEQGAAVLASPELLDWLYRRSRGENLINPSELLQLLTQQAVNAGLWLRDELDELARGLSWVLLPTFAPAPALRSPAEQLEAILTQLERGGMEISSTARAAYQDLNLAEISLRLYAVTWALLSPQSVPEWTLLLVLSALPTSTLPSGIQLRVSDLTGVLVEVFLDEQSEDSNLYARIVGTWDEKFLVTLSLSDGSSLTLPPFAFSPN